MLLAFSAASAALDAVKSLTAPKSSSSQPIGSGPAGSPFDISAPPSGGSPAVSGFSGGAQLSPATLSALLAAQSQSSTGAAALPATNPGKALQNLFSQIDANGDGQITKSEFENALGAGGTNIAQADHVFSQLDRNGDGTVGVGELASALRGSRGNHIHVDVGGSSRSGDSGGTGGSNSDPLLQALQGATSTSVTNSDGSTTTSLIYADGSKVTTTSAVPTTSSSAASSSYNLIEQLIQRQANAIATLNAPLSVNA